MRVLFMGTPDFASASLEALYNAGHDVCGVFTQPDRPKSRGMKTVFSPVKTMALEHNTPVYQPEKMRDGTALSIVKELSPDIIVVVAYGRILPKDILDCPKYGCVNIHGSILPKYRGSAPIQHAVLNGEKVTGVTAMYMDVGMDTGDIIDISEVQVGEYETAGELFDRLKNVGAELLVKTIASIEAGTAKRTPQNEELASYAPPLTKDMCPINWEKSTAQIINQIRGLNPWPVATCEIAGTKFKIYSARPLEITGPAGEIAFADKNGLAVFTSDGAVLIDQLQAPGGKRMNSADYLRGHPIC